MTMLQEQGEAVLEQGTSGATNLTLEVTNILLFFFARLINILLLFFRAVNRTLRK